MDGREREYLVAVGGDDVGAAGEGEGDGEAAGMLLAEAEQGVGPQHIMHAAPPYGNAALWAFRPIAMPRLPYYHHLLLSFSPPIIIIPPRHLCRRPLSHIYMHTHPFIHSYHIHTPTTTILMNHYYY